MDYNWNNYTIEFRDNLYKKLKACTTDSPEYELNQYNLKIYNGYLRQCIRAAKKQHYTHEFAKYKNDIRKTWDTLKDIMNKKKSKVEFPTYFLNNGKYLCGAKNIADKFNEYFIEIGPSLASEIDVSNKSPFNTYLTSPCTSSFYFQYTNPYGILKIIQGLKSKSSAGYAHLSSKVLKDIADIASTPLSIIINQSLCSGIFPSKLKIALFKKGDIQLFGNYRPISLLSSVSKVFEKAAYGQLYEYFSSHALFFDSSSSRNNFIPNRKQSTAYMSKDTTSVNQYILMFCWQSPEKPKAHLAGNQSWQQSVWISKISLNRTCCAWISWLKSQKNRRK